jgi:hypothetical protein|tara:strand:- start:67 stop:1740 length:1674 start_codon:yes stop_codon:yes gene_type:complete
MASLADIVKGIQETNELLTSNVKAQEKVQSLMADRDRDADAARMDALGATKKTSTKATRPRGFKANFKQSSGLTGLGKALGGAGNFASDLMGGILGKLALPIIIAAGVAFDQIVLDGKGMKKLKAWGSSIIAGIMDKLDFLNIIPDDDLLKVASSIMSAAGAGLLVALLSPKLGLMVFAGKLFADYAFDKIFTPAQQEDMKTSFNKGIQDTLGLDISEASLFKLGAGIAGLFGFGLLRSALAMAFTGVAAGGAAGGPKGGATVGRNSKGQFTKLNPKFASKFRLGFGGRLGLGLMMTSMGEQVGNYIGGAMGSEAIGDVVGKTLNAAAIGFMLAGPYGALIGALGTLAVVGFNKVQAWIDVKQNELNAKHLEEAMAIEAALQNTRGNSEAARFERARLNRLKSQNATAQAFEANRMAELGNDEQQTSLANRLATFRVGFSAAGVPDFFREGIRKGDSGRFYTGEGDDKMNPYKKDSEQALFDAFKKAAFAATLKREQNFQDSQGPRGPKDEFGAPIIVDASNKSFSDHKSVHMMPAVQPVTIDTYYPERGRPGFIDW